MLNAVEPGTDIPIHRHPDKDESFVILRGKVRSTTYNDDGSVIDSVVLSQEDGIYGVDIPKGVWHNLESLESTSVIFECKDGLFVPHEVDGLDQEMFPIEFLKPGRSFQINAVATEGAPVKMMSRIKWMEDDDVFEDDELVLFNH